MANQQHLPAVSVAIDRLEALDERSPVEADATEAGTVRVEDLESVEEVRVRTRNTVYRFCPAGGGQARFTVEGGTQFRTPTPVIVAGAAVAGRAIRPGCIMPGHPLVVIQGARCVVTSPVESVEIE